MRRIMMSRRAWAMRLLRRYHQGRGWLRRAWWHLEDGLTHWPLTPRGVWCRKGLWLGWLAAVAIAEVLMPPALGLFPVACVPVGLAAWCGSLPWSLGLALTTPWLPFVAWWWKDQPWALWVEGVNTAVRLALGLVAALGMTALQRQACRLALERDPRLPRRRAARAGAGGGAGDRRHQAAD